MDKKKQMQQIPMIASLIVANQTETPDATWTAADCDRRVSNGDRLPTELTTNPRIQMAMA
jgi:hypothetical protein